ncbi:MAG: metallophosphoesterase [Thermomicrobiales bacterium]
MRRGVIIGSSLGAVAIGAVAAYKARYINPYSPVLERISLPLPPGHEGLHGLTIGFLTDSHVGPFFSHDDLTRATKLLASVKPDLILLGGDYISESPRFIGPTVEVLRELVHASSHGGLAVMGNHDLSVSEPKVTEAFKSAGIPILRNAAAPVAHNGDTLWIAGVDESLLGTPDPARTFAQIPPGAACLAVWHEPSFAEQVAARGAFAQLSGHTHGGQIRLPAIGPVGLPADGRCHVIGFNTVAGMPVYTSRGVGVYRPPMRFRCPPEVTLVTLVAPERYRNAGHDPS